MTPFLQSSGYFRSKRSENIWSYELTLVRWIVFDKFGDVSSYEEAVYVGKLSFPATRPGGVWGGGRGYSSSFFTSALDGVSGQHHAPAALYPRGKDPGTHCIGGWVGSRAVWTLDLEEKSSGPVGDRTPIVQPIVRHYTDWATPAPLYVGGTLYLQTDAHINGPDNSAFQVWAYKRMATFSFVHFMHAYEITLQFWSTVTYIPL
jgi:hypothetical protein